MSSSPVTSIVHMFFFCNLCLCSRWVDTRTAKNTTLSEEQFLEMQERERYGYWHPRYRVPKPVFGFSRPFAHRHRPALK